MRLESGLGYLKKDFWVLTSTAGRKKFGGVLLWFPIGRLKGGVSNASRLHRGQARHLLRTIRKDRKCTAVIFSSEFTECTANRPGCYCAFISCGVRRVHKHRTRYVCKAVSASKELTLRSPWVSQVGRTPNSTCVSLTYQAFSLCSNPYRSHVPSRSSPARPLASTHTAGCTGVLSHVRLSSHKISQPPSTSISLSVECACFWTSE
jgi:hypothetical protein